MGIKTYSLALFVLLGVMHQLLLVCSQSIIPQWLDGKWEDDLTNQQVTIDTNENKVLWPGITVGGLQAEYITVEVESNVMLLRSVYLVPIRPPQFVYICMMFTQVNESQFYYYLLSEPDALTSPANTRLERCVEDNKSLCDVCQSTACRDKNDFNIMVKQGQTQSPVDDPEFPPHPCDMEIKLQDLLENLIQTVLSEGIKCKGRGSSEESGSFEESTSSDGSDERNKMHRKEENIGHGKERRNRKRKSEVCSCLRCLQSNLNEMENCDCSSLYNI